MNMKSAIANLSRLFWVATLVCVGLSTSVVCAVQEPAEKKTPATAAVPSGVPAKGFDTPQQAADAVVDAAAKFDVDALEHIFGSTGKNIVLTDEVAQDQQRAADFAARAGEKKSVTVDPKNKSRAILVVGNDDWPFPVPMIKRGTKWYFDAKAGEKEMLYRRVGANENDAIQVCRGYVEAQVEYALKKREGYDVNQYAQRIISTQGKQDGDRKSVV